MIYSSCRLHQVKVPEEKEENYLIQGRYRQAQINYLVHKKKLLIDTLAEIPFSKAELQKRYGHINFDLPWIIEFCSGTGEFLINLAQCYPQYFFLGVEVALPCIQRSLLKIGGKFLNNLLFYHGEGKDFLEHDFRDFKFKGMMVNFPDPWPKKKHIKRRIISSDFIVSVKARLEERGSFITATDVKSLNLYHREIIDPILTPIDLIEKDKDCPGDVDWMDFYRHSSNYKEKNLAKSEEVFFTHHCRLD